MREALNSNPLAQMAVIAVLLIGAGFFVLSSSGGGEEEPAAETDAPTSVAETESAALPAAAPPTGGIPATAAPPLPRPVLQAWKDNRPVVLLVVRDGGIDDNLVKATTVGLAGFRDVATFVVPARQVYRYAAITEGVGVDRVPALVVVTPRHLDQSVPTASVSFGYQSPASVAQAVIDAGYEGPTVDYHP